MKRPSLRIAAHALAIFAVALINGASPSPSADDRRAPVQAERRAGELKCSSCHELRPEPPGRLDAPPPTTRRREILGLFLPL